MEPNKNGSPAVVARQQSIVVVTGYHVDGDSQVVQEIMLSHGPGVGEPDLIGNALSLVRQAGGLMLDGDGGSVNFFPLREFKKINFAVKRVVLASSSTLVQ